MSRILELTAAAVLVVGATWATSAMAASDDFCRDYARDAIRQVHMAMDSHCDRAMDDSNQSRWGTDWRVHYDWCRGVSKNEANNERNIRRRMLGRCLNGE